MSSFFAKVGMRLPVDENMRNELFAATERFHEAAPWEVFANEQFLHLKNEATGEEAWAMVCGHTDYAGRGLNLFSNERDLKEAYTGGPGVRCTGGMNRLQFVAPDMASFSVLDDIANLRLPLATNDPTGEVVPCWYRRTKPEELSIESIAEAWGNPPPHESWPFLSAAVRAAGKPRSLPTPRLFASSRSSSL